MSDGTSGTGIDASIVLVVHNGMPYLEESLCSLLEQAYDPARFEVIAVDDGSSDDSLALLERYAATHANLVVVPMEHTGSPAAPRNAGIDLARGRYMFFFDADDLLAPYSLTDMVTVADANDVDIVVPKQAALGARAVPIRGFRSTLPSTDIFAADVYRVLAPRKLFRTSFVREHGFRFPLDARRKSDVPFSVQTYLAARRIAVLADRDYVSVRLRDDGGNLTLNRTKLRDHMPVVLFVFDTVADKIGPGPHRDLLMVRHFRTEMAKAVLEGFPGEEDDVYRRECFDRFVKIARDYCNAKVLEALPVRERVVMSLILEDRYSALCDIAPALSSEKQAAVVREGRTLYLRHAGFRDPAFGIPDRMFRVVAGACLQCSLMSAAPSAGGPMLDFVARILVSNERIDGVRLLLTDADSVETCVLHDATGVPVSMADVRELSFSVPAQSILAMDRKGTPGPWAVRLEASIDGIRLNVPVYYMESAKLVVDEWPGEAAGPAADGFSAVRITRNDAGRLVVGTGTVREATKWYQRAVRRGRRVLRLALKRFV